LRVIRPGADNTEALAWLERALEHARDRGQKRIENLLKTVRTELVFEMRLIAGALDDRSPTDGEIGEG